MDLLRTVLGILAMLLAPGLHAQCTQIEPGCSMVFSQSRPAALKYECKIASESRITCNFIQLDVQKWGYPSVDESLRTVWPSMDDKQCAEAGRALEDALKVVPEASAQPTRRMREEEHRIDRLKATVDYCKTGNREVFRESLAREHDKQQKTCHVFVHSYVQTFRRESVGAGAARWVTEEQPSGKCRVHREAEFTRNGDSSWSYSARYKVMNKSGQDGQLSCGEIKEQEAIYVSTPNEEAGWIECETVNFDGACYSPDFPCLGGPPVVVF